jgi:hypothetical protein
MRDWIPVVPFPANRVIENGVHNVPHLCLAAIGQLQRAQPFLYSDGSNILHAVRTPTRQYPFAEDEYQSCSGEEMAIVYRHGETINDEARRDDDGAAIPCIVWKRAAVWRAVEPATVARRV